MCNQCNQNRSTTPAYGGRVSSPDPGLGLLSELEAIVTSFKKTPAAPIVDRKKVSCAGMDKSFPIFKAMGTTDPVAALEKIAQRAVAMLDNTISELTRIRTRIQAGDPIGSPLIDDTLALSLAKRMRIKVNDSAAWKGDGPGKVGLVIRWLTNIRNLIASRDLWYTCLATDCGPGDWAFVFDHADPQNLANKDKLNFFRIHLCRRFWNPGIDKATGKKITPDKHFEFQAQTIIHETSHIYYNTSDDPGLGAGVAECLSQFVAEANGSPLDNDFMNRCGGKLK